MKENKPDLSGIYSSNIREMLQKLLHCNPKERPSAKALLDQQWLVSMVNGEGEYVFTTTEHNSDNPSKVKSKLAAKKKSRKSRKSSGSNQ